MNAKKHTIKDVAELAGVSKGTVDRVLHKRGKVSKKAYEKVDRALKELDFIPNPIARNLKNNKIYKIAVLLPDSNLDPYWKPARKGIKSAAQEFKPFGVLVEEFLYNPYDKESFIHRSNEAMNVDPDVVLMAPLFQEESIKVYELCKERKVLLALFNNYIDSIQGEFFIGQDLEQCGRIGANLIDKMVKKDYEIAIIHINMEPHMQLKENGFRNYFKELGYQENKLTIKRFNTSNLANFENEVFSFIKTNPNIKAFFVTNSKVHLLVAELQKFKFKCTVVGFDLLDENIKYLENGEIDFLIHQKPKRQAYLGVGYLAEYFLFGKPVPTQRFLPIDIITSENVKYYLK
ncbi:LacI family DNA-binding transcriptional regulator [Maribacter sp. HTCC2170]|uniref:LacI family DNA-binding transcriptional regulator n=1 Tax=Maribacter sp. (strain HTCC2170 / KCCM 42371) TaxID=313603 RepID=UPI00006BB846|nr:LacI family DNA-binding transcriptional regulator [Maribacter sp. HTCC2170]EAQ99731.1 putative LacI-family transcriptional regulator [Maribacter sp. HTCC2170]